VKNDLWNKGTKEVNNLVSGTLVNGARITERLNGAGWCVVIDTTWYGT